MATPLLVMRNSMLEVLSEDYVEMAHAKGIKPRKVLFRHAARNALLPVVTSGALFIGSAIGGQVLIEVVFSWPGLGGDCDRRHPAGLSPGPGSAHHHLHHRHADEPGGGSAVCGAGSADFLQSAEGVMRMTTKSLVRRSNTQSVLRQFLKNLRRDKLAMVGVILLVFFIVVAIFATSLAPHGARTATTMKTAKSDAWSRPPWPIPLGPRT